MSFLVSNCSFYFGEILAPIAGTVQVLLLKSFAIIFPIGFPECFDKKEIFGYN